MLNFSSFKTAQNCFSVNIKRAFNTSTSFLAALKTLISVSTFEGLTEWKFAANIRLMYVKRQFRFISTFVLSILGIFSLIGTRTL